MLLHVLAFDLCSITSGRGPDRMDDQNLTIEDLEVLAKITADVHAGFMAIRLPR